MALQLAAVAMVSVIAHFTKNSVFWVVAGAMAAFTGFYWFDRFNDNLGLAFGILFLLYALNCLAMGFRFLFVSNPESEVEDV